MAHILVVDDEYLTVQMLGTYLKLIGHQTAEAFSAQQAWERVAARIPDAILLDIMLPDVNGIQLCRELRANPPTAAIPILMISAQAPPLLKEAEEAGANGYLIKPLNMLGLRSALDKAGVTASSGLA